MIRGEVKRDAARLQILVSKIVAPLCTSGVQIEGRDAASTLLH